MPSQKQINKIKERVNSSKLSEMNKIFSVLSDETRLKSLTIFFENSLKNLCVSDVAKILEVTVPAASYQLSKLESVGFLIRTKDGKRVCYRLNKDNELTKFLKKFN